MTTAERRLRTRLRSELSAHPIPEPEPVLAALPTRRARRRTGPIVHAAWAVFAVAVAAIGVGLMAAQPQALITGISLTLAAVGLAKAGAGIRSRPGTQTRVTARQLLLSGLVESD